MAEHNHEHNINEKKAQELYMQFQIANQQINDIQKQIQMLEESMLEIRESKKGLEEISKIDCNKEILVPIVSGIFAKAEIKDAKEFIINVGSNTAVAKSAEDVQKILDNQLEEMQKAQNSFIDTLHQLTVTAKETRSQLKQLVEH